MHHQGHRWAWKQGGSTQTLTPPPTPAIVQLSPDSSGPWDAEVRILGSGFTPDSQVYVGGNKYNSGVTYIDEGELRVVVRATAPTGSYDVLVRNIPFSSNTMQYTKY